MTILGGGVKTNIINGTCFIYPINISKSCETAMKVDTFCYQWIESRKPRRKPLKCPSKYILIFNSTQSFVGSSNNSWQELNCRAIFSPIKIRKHLLHKCKYRTGISYRNLLLMLPLNLPSIETMFGVGLQRVLCMLDNLYNKKGFFFYLFSCLSNLPQLAFIFGIL